MTLGRFFALVIGLALWVGTTGAQVRPDSVRADTTRRPGTPPDTTVAIQRAPVDTAALLRAQAKRDSVAAFRAADTIKSPLARFEAPQSFEIDDTFRFNRDQILQSEATNLSDLLARVPGVTSYSTGWLASIHLASYLGDFRHVRVFMDGVELDAIDPRSGGVLDLSNVYLWMLDEVVIERAAGDLRVWCRSSTTTRTTAYTRTDIYTGDLNTNGFRAIFARRYQNGFALQAAGQQFNTQQGRATLSSVAGTAGRGNGGNQTFDVRIGWSRRKLSIDGFAVVTTRDRDSQLGADSAVVIPAFRGARREGYVRVGYGDTTNGFWSQLMLNSLKTRLEGIRATTDDDTSKMSDTTRSRQQNVLAVGYRTNSAQLSFTDRLRTFDGKAYNAPAVRAAYTRDRLTGGLFLEGSPLDSAHHLDASIRFVPTGWATLAFNETVRTYDEDTGRSTEQVARLDGGVRYKRLWLLGGIIKETPTVQTPPRELVGAVQSLTLRKATGLTFGIHGRLYKELGVELQGVRFVDDTLRAFQPRMSVRTDLGLQTDWLSRFPKGQFGFNGHIIHEYRNPISFYYAGATADSLLQVTSISTQVYTALVEIRIQRAVLFYHFHNITGQAYQLVPGVVMPRQIQFYGVRWEFWN